MALAYGGYHFLNKFQTNSQFANVSVIDGDSLRTGNRDIRLHGIDAPEYRQTCLDAHKRPYPCGKRAAEHLRRLVRGGPVNCRIVDEDRYGREIAICSGASGELNRAMVRDGWAVAYLRYSLAYSRVQARATQERLGLWAGTFKLPQDWRAENRSRTRRGNRAGAVD